MTTNKELRELAEKATQGAWGEDGVYVCTTITAGETIYAQTWDVVAESHQESNAQFIAAANPATILALLDENEALQAECEKLRKDAERLDFIAQHPGWLRSHKGRWGCVSPFTNYSYPVFKTPRDAIDAAMQGDNP